MKVAIVGFGLEGKSALNYWVNLGADIIVCDQDLDKAAEIPAGILSQLGKGYLENLSRFDLIVRSAGVNPSVILAKNPGVKNKITSVMNEFLKVSPTKHVIGITGTKGKGTTSTLIANMLETTGQKVFLGGNIGASPLEFLSNLTKNSYVVLEFSSFQLSDLNYCPAISICLMVVPEHLNWHADMDDYVLAKANLFKHQNANDIAIYYAQNDISKKIASSSPGHKIPFYGEPGAHIEENKIVIAGQIVCRTNDLKLLGEHNWQNACAAVTAAWQVNQNIKAMRSVLTTFQALPHRLELIDKIKNVAYYNDSFASTPDAAIAALHAIIGTKVMILGGFDRHLPIHHLATEILNCQDDLRKVIIIGASADRLAKECDKIGFSNYLIDRAQTMSEIVAKANSLAVSGDSVVLSPGFASFDMFKNFEVRGEKFKEAVKRL
ncbi:MAG: UDP-N-acetylmuramoyl-L-alanine--D-glutamate ligase [Candidatus Saccharimonadales bacterium]